MDLYTTNNFYFWIISELLLDYFWILVYPDIPSLIVIICITYRNV